MCEDTLGSAVVTVSDDLLTNEERVVCNKCSYVSFECNNWIAGLGRVCNYCASEHFGSIR